MTVRKWTSRFLSAGGFFMAAAACAGPCQISTLDTYTTPGFSCSVGNILYSDFAAYTDFIGNKTYGNVNAPSLVTVTPESGGGGSGFNFSNLGVSFTGGTSSLTSGVNFTATALSGLITGASLALGIHDSTGPGGTSVAYFQDAGSAFVITVADPRILVGNSYYDTVRTTDSATFAGLSSEQFYTGGSAVVNGFDGGTASIGDYTILLSTTNTDSTATPEPASLFLVGGALAALGSAHLHRNARRTAGCPGGDYHLHRSRG